jgi:hypothetical protein
LTRLILCGLMIPNQIPTFMSETPSNAFETWKKNLPADSFNRDYDYLPKAEKESLRKARLAQIRQDEELRNSLKAAIAKYFPTSSVTPQVGLERFEHFKIRVTNMQARGESVPDGWLDFIDEFEKATVELRNNSKFQSPLTPVLDSHEKITDQGSSVSTMFGFLRKRLQNLLKSVVGK